MSSYGRFVAVVVTASIILSACASPSRVPIATSATLLPKPTTTARVLTRADLPAGVTSPSTSADRDEETTDSTPDYKAAVGALPRVGSTAPDFTLRTIEGDSIILSKLRGHPLLINFWASWCMACRAEAPELQKLYTEYKQRGLIILGVNTTQQDTVDSARAYVSEFKLTYSIPMDENGHAVKAYGVMGLPTSFFVDPEGIIRNVVIGQMDRATMLEGLALAQLTQP